MSAGVSSGAITLPAMSSALTWAASSELARRSPARRAAIPTPIRPNTIRLVMANRQTMDVPRRRSAGIREGIGRSGTG